MSEKICEIKKNKRGEGRGATGAAVRRAKADGRELKRIRMNIRIGIPESFRVQTRGNRRNNNNHVFDILFRLSSAYSGRPPVDASLSAAPPFPTFIPIVLFRLGFPSGRFFRPRKLFIYPSPFVGPFTSRIRSHSTIYLLRYISVFSSPVQSFCFHRSDFLRLETLRLDRLLRFSSLFGTSAALSSILAG